MAPSKSFSSVTTSHSTMTHNYGSKQCYAHVNFTLASFGCWWHAKWQRFVCQVELHRIRFKILAVWYFNFSRARRMDQHPTYPLHLKISSPGQRYSSNQIQAWCSWHHKHTSHEKWSCVTRNLFPVTRKSKRLPQQWILIVVSPM